MKCPHCKKTLTEIHVFQEYRTTWNVNKDGERLDCTDDGSNRDRYEHDVECPHCQEQLPDLVQ